jgi:hypothetical protein
MELLGTHWRSLFSSAQHPGTAAHLSSAGNAPCCNVGTRLSESPRGKALGRGAPSCVLRGGVLFWLLRVRNCESRAPRIIRV